MPELTLDRLKYLLDYNPVTGQFHWRVYRNSNARAGQRAGTVSEGQYRQISLDNKVYYEHRLAVFYMTGKWPDVTVDHESTRPQDNSWKNLRNATYSENGQNQKKPGARNKSGVLGVYWSRSRQRWVAQLILHGKKVFCKAFKDKDVASEAYREAKKLFHPYETISHGN